ncbi:hypothetical protein FQR65_LT20520 [Abscondita terminalis]|nr:hypothetical protein FQR65_LT20520 [Abscondita terminalis]
MEVPATAGTGSTINPKGVVISHGNIIHNQKNVKPRHLKEAVDNTKEAFTIPRPKILHLILSAVLKSPKEVGLTNEIHTVFLNSLQRDFSKELVPVVLAPLVYPNQYELAPEMSSEGPGLSGGMLDSSLADLVSEMGRDINPAAVARTLALLCRTHSGLDESLNLPGSFNKDGRNTWNVEVVMVELDHPDFVIKDRQGLIMLISALRLGLKNVGFHPETFPVDHLYRRWTNVDGQFSLVQQILKNPDVFCFADYPFLSVPVDILKTPPEQDSKELECGLYPQVQDLFKLPLQNCPDVLVLTLLQISGPVTMLRQELFTNLIPMFLGNHPNSAIILHHAWHTQTLNIKHIIMHAMADWYARGEYDQTRLSRILDVAQDLKALSMLLNAQSYPFIIDLACLASRREYLKLEKWITDKIRDHGEPFQPSAILRSHRTLDGPFNPSSMAQQLYNTANVDPIGISTLANMNLGGPTNSAFNLQGGLGPLVPSPGSRLEYSQESFRRISFFSSYPDKELHITAQLFGGIIERGLVTSYMALGLALRFVLDALKKPEGSKMYYFGIAALDRFKSRLKEYHKYCEHVRTISHFSEFPPHLMEYVEYGLQSLEPPNKPQGPFCRLI